MSDSGVGYELIYDLPQPTPMIMVLGTHFSRASDVVVPDHLTTNPAVPISPYRDGFGNWCSRIVAPAGRMRLSADGIVRDSGLPDVVAPTAPQHRGRGPARRDAGLSPRQPLLRDRSPVRDRPGSCSKARRRAGRASRRSAISSTTTSRSATSMRAPTKTACEAFNERNGRVPRLRPPRHRLLPLHEHPGALLHRLSRRHRHAAALRPDGFRRLVRGLSRRPLVHVRPAQQHAAHRPRADRARAAMPPTCRSPTPSAPTRWSASRSGPTR